MEAFGVMLWAIAALLVAVPLVLAAVFVRRRPTSGNDDSGGTGVWERYYLAASWASYPLAAPMFLLTLLPANPDLPAALVILGLLRMMLGVLLAPVGALLMLLAICAPAHSARRNYVPWLAVSAAANLLPILLVTLKR
jgi:hypothetical protein